MLKRVTWVLSRRDSTEIYPGVSRFVGFGSLVARQVSRPHFENRLLSFHPPCDARSSLFIALGSLRKTAGASVLAASAGASVLAALGACHQGPPAHAAPPALAVHRGRLHAADAPQLSSGAGSG